jgi:hypothetical protein
MSDSTGIARARLGDLLAAAIPVPDPTVSESQFDRYEHRDLEHALTEDLERELVGLQLLNGLDAGGPWHQLREERIREVLAQRRAS